MPLSVINKTLQAATQLAKNHLRLLLRRYFKSRFPQLNRNRLHERYCTDTYFSSVTTIGTKATCAQIFTGVNSLFTRVYGMTTESQGPAVLETFIAEVGAPYYMMNDHARMETSRAWREILRKYNIPTCTTEP